MRKGKDSPCFIDRVGETWKTNQGYQVTIIECFGANNCTILFLNGFILKKVNYRHIKEGRVKNPYHLSVLGIGYEGSGDYSSKINRVAHKCWRNIITRCYHEKSRYKNPTYKDVEVCEEWHNFQNFAEWHSQNYSEGFELDKDILVKGSKIYSDKTCTFVPREINNLFIKSNKTRGQYLIGVVIQPSKKFQAFCCKNGKQEYIGTFDTELEAFQAYKEAKEVWIKELANKYIGKITEQTYQSLMNYQVQITD